MDSQAAAKFFRSLGSTWFSLICMGLTMLLVIAGTLAQANMGTFAAQARFFNSFFVSTHVGGFRLPVLPGGLTLAGLWLLSLSSSLITKFGFYRRNFGLLVTHCGIFILILGQLLTQLLAQESMMAIEKGQTGDYSESRRQIELAVTQNLPGEQEQLTSVPGSLLTPLRTIELPNLPFSIYVEQFFQNAQLKPGGAAGPNIIELPPTNDDDEIDNTAALLQIKEGAKIIGRFVVALALSQRQEFSVNGETYHIALRQKRYYLPFSLTLKNFTHEVYPGTDIPKNFASQVHLQNPTTGESRDALIYMNHPLRYAGMTFYQASYGKNDTLSIFQVVKNPAWVTPYLSCAIVTLGLVLQFSLTFFRTRQQSL